MAKKSKVAEIKTKETGASVDRFIQSVKDEAKIKDSLVLLDMMKKASGETAKMWGSSIIGFGNKRYKSPSGREVDWFHIGFSPRKANLSVYLMIDHKKHAVSIKKLGKHKTSGGCIYINTLEDIDLKVLNGLLVAAVKEKKD